MKFRYLIILIFLLSCVSPSTILNTKKSYSAKGFVYIYNDYDFDNKIIKGKMINDKMQISHQNLKIGTLLKITNPKNKKNMILKNIKRIKYPDFYKLIITKSVADELELDAELPILEIIEIKKNKSFVAEKAKIYNEEKKIPSKAPVASVQISNISKNKKKESNKKSSDIYIHIATFYSVDTAKFLKQRILQEISEFNKKKIKIKKVNNKKTQVISGPYNSVNLVKNDYIKLKNYGFEQLDIFTDD